MAVLSARRSRLAIAFVLVASCYSPDAPDCTLACTGDSDCVVGQACTTDHFCAGTGIASCAVHAMNDASSATGSDAGTGSGSGSASYVTLTVHVDGNGSASTDSGQTCDSFAMPKDCPLQVVKDAPLTVTATPHVTKTFDKWAGGPCDGQLATCHFTPNAPTTVQAKFKN